MLRISLYMYMYIYFISIINLSVLAHNNVCFLNSFFALCRVGAIFFTVMNQIFSNMNAVDLFIRQKALFM